MVSVCCWSSVQRHLSFSCSCPFSVQCLLCCCCLLVLYYLLVSIHQRYLSFSRLVVLCPLVVAVLSNIILRLPPPLLIGEILRLPLWSLTEQLFFFVVPTIVLLDNRTRHIGQAQLRCSRPPVRRTLPSVPSVATTLPGNRGAHHTMAPSMKNPV